MERATGHSPQKCDLQVRFHGPNQILGQKPLPTQGQSLRSGIFIPILFVSYSFLPHLFQSWAHTWVSTLQLSFVGKRQLGDSAALPVEVQQGKSSIHINTLNR